MLKTFLSPWGRRPRLTYWRAAALIPLFAMFGLLLAPIGLGLMPDSFYLGTNVGRIFISVLVTAIIFFAALWAGLAVAIQRLHDRDCLGWWVLIALVPVLGSLWYLFWNGLRPGTPGPNRFGPDPLAPNDAVVAVFGDGPVRPRRMRKPIVSTMVAWTLLLAILAVDALVLFQNPGRRTPRPPTTPTQPIER